MFKEYNFQNLIQSTTSIEDLNKLQKAIAEGKIEEEAVIENEENVYTGK